jgi:hypothetical protein
LAGVRGEYFVYRTQAGDDLVCESAANAVDDYADRVADFLGVALKGKRSKYYEFEDLCSSRDGLLEYGFVQSEGALQCVA